MTSFRNRRIGHLVELAIGEANSLPTEFRLFVPGWNETENGRFLFDAEAASATMDAYRRWGVDLSIDLEHQMLDSMPTPDPTARDARGWAKLELRPDGSLWAVDVRWTNDGAARLTEKRQRYVSPAFEIDPESKRVTKIINVAITAIPATHNTPALVAASARGSMDPKLVQQALDALINGDAKAALEILQNLIASAAGADPDAATEDAPPPAGDGGADEMTESAAPAAAPAEAPAPAADDEEKKAAVVATSALVRLTGKSNASDALAEVKIWKTAFDSMAAERAALEADKRRKLCIELVTLGAEFPSTVWADPSSTKLKARWESMPMAALEEHVAEQRSARASKRAPAPPKGAAPSEAPGKVVQTSFGPVTLSARELKVCEEVKADLQKYAENKALKEASARRGA